MLQTAQLASKDVTLHTNFLLAHLQMSAEHLIYDIDLSPLSGINLYAHTVHPLSSLIANASGSFMVPDNR